MSFLTFKTTRIKLILLVALLLFYMYMLIDRQWEIFTNFFLLFFLNVYFLVKNQTIFQKLSGRISAFIFTNMAIVYWDHGTLVYLFHNTSLLSRKINNVIIRYESIIAVKVYNYFNLDVFTETRLYLNLFERAYWVLLIIFVFFIGDIIAKWYLKSINYKVEAGYNGDYNLWWKMNKKKIDKRLIRITVIWILIFYLV
ncbi:MAG: hypothetical protein E7204_06100 [Veillonella sp.]|uniref:hypothetical protein n=1 Tax=Veillonella sp. TaxID=1926307 RepID=UPI0025CC1634|nr:hypothetical protein [Veillonella sp.]MBE6080390.1 hypothetical protein [Veillonella sp.]